MKGWRITLCLMLGLLLGATPAMAAQETKGLTLTTEAPEQPIPETPTDPDAPATPETTAPGDDSDAGTKAENPGNTNAPTGVANDSGALAAAAAMFAAAGGLGVIAVRRRRT